MLDQNTDRMWYVIGAVIVGAALIFLMNGTFPTLFANVGETFEDKVADATTLVEETTTEMTDGIKPKSRNLLDVKAAAAQIANGTALVYDTTYTYGFIYRGLPNTEYTVSTDVPIRQVDKWYTEEYDVFVTTAEMHTPSSHHNGVMIDAPRTVMTDASGEVAIWFRGKSVFDERITIEDIVKGDYFVQLEKGSTATEYVPF